jgi:uncharacterized phage-associated protein
MNEPTKNARVLKYFTQRAPGSLGVTQLLKLAYLADLHAREYLGRPITTFDYTFYRHGPFDRRLYTTVEELESHRWVRTERESFFSGKSKRHVFNASRVEPDLGFTPAEERILDYVARTYAHLPLQALLEAVYQTEPMKAARRDGRVPMDLVNNKAKHSLGYDLEEVLGEEREIERGNFVSASDFFDALHAEIVSEDCTQH